MCYKGKCLFCIPVENGCLVFAVLSAIVTIIWPLACVVIWLLTIAGVIIVAQQIKHESEFNWPGMDQQKEAATSALAFGGLAISVITLISSIPSLIAFIFSVLLCNGICKRRPGQVKAYFIYGVTITVLAVIAAIVQMAISYDPYLGLMGLLGCVIYSLLLWMVFETYTKISAGVVFKDHIRLVESC